MLSDTRGWICYDISRLTNTCLQNSLSFDSCRLAYNRDFKCYETREAVKIDKPMVCLWYRVTHCGFSLMSTVQHFFKVVKIQG